jgi:hypothetical protein
MTGLGGLPTFARTAAQIRIARRAEVGLCPQAAIDSAAVVTGVIGRDVFSLVLYFLGALSFTRRVIATFLLGVAL